VPRLFITGATGFVGRHVAERFLRAGWEITALTRGSSNTQALASAGCTVHAGELTQADSFQAAIEGCDVVAHCAGLIKATSWEQFRRVNVDGAGEVALAAARGCVPRFVHISSIAAAGPTSGTGESEPVSQYGRSKLDGERRVFDKSGGMQVCIVRPPILYGPYDHGMLPVFKAARRGFIPLYGRGDHRISILHAHDLAGAIFDLATRTGRLPPGPFYPEDGSNPTWLELVEAMERAVRRGIRRMSIPPPLIHAAGGIASFWSMLFHSPSVFSLDKVREMAQPSWVFSHKSLKQAVGWSPRIRLAEGLGETYRWYKENGWL
jgi:nucleoside-diphosphate-sugar epimerase